ncbi:MAG: iron-containing alcohol dehydrogenase, partial [Spirochaetia bacterium]|nr:iron-containing alcohol dehydrogenase [Spirochaetia bacterium]
MSGNVKKENALGSFQASRTPFLYFGKGSISFLEKTAHSLDKGTAAVFTGSSFLEKSGFRDKISMMLTGRGRKVLFFAIPGEPSPSVVDDAVEEIKRSNVSFVAAIGGGSVVDAGKAASVMALHKGSVRDYLEGVGTLHLSGRKLPFIAVPTTSGTGSEATKNSVISSVGKEGFKKSLRDESMVPDYAIIDPDLMLSCPPEITASSGMDAVTQLIESFVSTKASVYTDSLASAALKAAGENLEKAVFNCSDIDSRAAMAWGAYVSGITLTAAGLGVV